MSKSYRSTKMKVHQVEIEFTKKKITAYGGLSLLAAFFRKDTTQSRA